MDFHKKDNKNSTTKLKCLRSNEIQNTGRQQEKITRESQGHNGLRKSTELTHTGEKQVVRYR